MRGNVLSALIVDVEGLVCSWTDMRKITFSSLTTVAVVMTFVVHCSVVADQPESDEEAFDAYWDHLDAFNSDDARRYFTMYSPILSCWYSGVNHSRADVVLGGRGFAFDDQVVRRFESVRLTPIFEGNDEVHFLDQGRIVGPEDARSYRKIIVLRRVAGDWLVVVEVSAGDAECYLEYFERTFEMTALPTKDPSAARTITGYDPLEGTDSDEIEGLSCGLCGFACSMVQTFSCSRFSRALRRISRVSGIGLVFDATVTTICETGLESINACDSVCAALGFCGFN